MRHFPLIVSLLSLVHALVLLWLVCGCAPTRLNPGAQMPWLRVDCNGMTALLLSGKAPASPVGTYTSGLFTGSAIAELEGATAPWTRTHELAHAADACGSYWTALALVTPPNPTPHMAGIIANLRADCEAADRLGGTPDALWRVLFNRYGAEAIAHRDILTRIGAP